MKTNDEILEHIRQVLPDAAPTEEQASAMKHVLGFQEEHQIYRMNLLILAMLFCQDLMKAQPTVDKEAAMRVAASSLVDSVALLVRALKRRTGSELDPARFALVSYAMADAMLEVPWTGTIEEIFNEDTDIRAELAEAHGTDVSNLVDKAVHP